MMSKARAEHPLRIGVAEVDITPRPGMGLGGDACRRRPCEGAFDPLHCRCLAFECADGAPGLLLAFELCIPGDDFVDDARARMADRFGIAPERIVIHFHQNHSAPTVGSHHLFRADSPWASEEYWWTYMGDPAYRDFLTPLMTDAVEEALSTMRPVVMTTAGLPDARISRNRRFLMRDGSVLTQPKPSDLPHVLCCEGPVDPETGVACFHDDGGNAVAAILHHTGHPVSRFGTDMATASWPGAWARQFRAAVGEACVPVVLNGCCGNINISCSLPEASDRDDETVGAWLTETSLRALDGAEQRATGVVDMARAEVPIPLGRIENQFSREDIEDAEHIMASEPEPRWGDAEKKRLDVEWIFAAFIMDLRRRMRPGASYAYDMQAIRIGDLGVVGLVGEPFVEGQLDIKARSPAKRTFVAHNCNGYIGYIPPRDAWTKRNINGVRPDGRSIRRGANLFILDPDALDIICRTSASMLDELFA